MERYYNPVVKQQQMDLLLEGAIKIFPKLQIWGFVYTAYFAVFFWNVLLLFTPTGVALSWLRMCSRHAYAMMFLVTFGSAAWMLVIGGFALQVQPSIGAVILLISALVVALWMYFRRRIADCTGLLSQAVRGLEENRGLVRLSLKSAVIASTFLMVLSAFGLAARAVGRPVPNPTVVSRLDQPVDTADVWQSMLLSGYHFLKFASHKMEGRDWQPPSLEGQMSAVVYDDHCGVYGIKMPCCSWELSQGTKLYTRVLAAALLWGLMTVGAARKLVVAQVLDSAVGPSAVTKSIQLATGPEAGTAAFAAAVSSVLFVSIPLLFNFTRSYWLGSFFGLAAVLGVALLLSAAQFTVGRMALVWAAIRKQGLLQGGRDVLCLLAGNTSGAACISWMPAAVVVFTSTLTMALWGGCMVAGLVAGVLLSSMDLLGLVVGVLVPFGSLWMVMALVVLGCLLTDAVDAAFVCEAAGRAVEQRLAVAGRRKAGKSD